VISYFFALANGVCKHIFPQTRVDKGVVAVGRPRGGRVAKNIGWIYLLGDNIVGLDIARAVFGESVYSRVEQFAQHNFGGHDIDIDIDIDIVGNDYLVLLDSHGFTKRVHFFLII